MYAIAQSSDVKLRAECDNVKVFQRLPMIV